MLLVPAAALVVCTALLYPLYRALYNVFFHPLAKIPGPKLYSISDYFYLYHQIRGDWHHVLKGLHDQYGPVVRVGPTDVSFITPEAWKTIYGHKNDASRSFEKDLRFYRQTPSGAPTIVGSKYEDHKRMRRLLAHAFSEKALRNQEGVLKYYTDSLIQKLSELAHQGKTVDMVRWYNFTTFDLIGDLAFGEPFGCLESGGYHPFVALIFDMVHMIAFTQIIKRKPYLAPLKSIFFPKKLVKNTLETWKLTRSTVLRRLESQNIDREDFMSYILRHNDEKGMSTDEIIENSGTLITAGSETTATQLSGTTFHLLTNRDKYDKLVEEIRSTFASEDEITISSVNRLQYMLAVFDESFRLYPPVPIGLPRLTPEHGEYMDGYWIPENTVVSAPHWATYRSERYWKDPLQFIPERWLGDPRFADDARDMLNPFSLGPRNCIGRNLAYAEMRLILARVLWNFDLDMMPDSKDWDKQGVFFLWDKKELHVKLTPVKR